MNTTAERNTKKPAPPEQPREFPFDAFAETALVASCMLWPAKIDDVSLLMTPNDFHDPAKGLIFKTVCELHAANKAIDPITVSSALEKKNQLASCGGIEKIAELYEGVPHGGHAEHYAKIVAEKSQRRALIQCGHNAVGYGRDELLPIDEAVGRAETQLTAVLERLAGKQTVTVDSVMMDLMDRMEGRKATGLKTGFHGFDDMTRGLLPGNLVILAARPGMGKTAFSANIAERIARRGTPVGFLSLEQSVSELIDRLLCAATKLPMSVIREPVHLTEAQRDEILKQAHSIASLPIIYDDTSNSIVTLEASARIMRRRDKIELLIVDYLQFITPENRRDPREQQVADMVRRLKRLGKVLGIPVICLAQLNREVEKTDNKRPKLSNLRESGAIEQDADIIAFVHREGDKAVLIVAKHRNGATGDIDMIFQEQYMQFQDAAASHFTGKEPPVWRQPYSDLSSEFNDAAESRF